MPSGLVLLSPGHTYWHDLCNTYIPVFYHFVILYAAAFAPTMLMAVQEGPTGIRVSWTPPAPLGDTTGYRIYYSGGSNGSVGVSGGSTHDYLLFGLINGMNYNISIVGTSKHLPSKPVSFPNRISLSELA